MRFDDAKVLRSNETTLIQEELRILYSTLETGENDIQDLKKLTSIGAKIEQALGNYYERVESAIMAARNNIRSGADETQVNAAVNMVVTQLDQDYGQELAQDIFLTMPEWQWLTDRWKRNNRFVGLKEMRLKLLRIDDVIMNAKGVALLGKNKQAWIENEPEPTSLRDNSSNGHTRSDDGADTQEIESAEQIRPISMRPA